MKTKYLAFILCVICAVSISAQQFKFKAMDGETLTDKRTGLVWLRDAGISGKMKWKDAFTFCDNLKAAGYDDWRLPTKAEFMTIVEDYPELESWIPLMEKDGFSNVQKEYWTATEAFENSPRAWGVDMRMGTVDRFTKDVSARMLWVLPVRGKMK